MFAKECECEKHVCVHATEDAGAAAHDQQKRNSSTFLNQAHSLPTMGPVHCCMPFCGRNR